MGAAGFGSGGIAPSEAASGRGSTFFFATSAGRAGATLTASPRNSATSDGQVVEILELANPHDRHFDQRPAVQAHPQPGRPSGRESAPSPASLAVPAARPIAATSLRLRRQSRRASAAAGSRPRPPSRRGSSRSVGRAVVQFRRRPRPPRRAPPAPPPRRAPPCDSPAR